MNEDLTRQLLRRIAALERRLGIVETSEAGAAHSHSSYLNRDGSVALTADWDIGDGRKLIADVVRARDAAGLSLQDDGGNEAAQVLDGGILAIPSVLRTTVSQSIANNSAYSFSIYGEWGFLLLVTPAVPETSCLISFRVSASVSACTVVAQPATTVVATTGVLTGTTGSDNKLTVSAHTDRKIYIENRIGTARTLRWLVIDMA